MKTTILSSLLLALPIFTNAANFNSPNDVEPGTQGQHIDYDCTNDPLGCQNMCYYMYCRGRTNAVQKLADTKHVPENRRGVGYFAKVFDVANRILYGTTAVSNAHTCPDEFPWASSRQGGEGGQLIGHDTAYRVQGGRIRGVWQRLGNNLGWLEPYNWDPNLSPACNCKPNWPEHIHYNPYGALCDCGKDKRKDLIYEAIFTPGQDRPKCSNPQPKAGWDSAKWNYLGYSKMKKRAEEAAEARAQAKRELPDTAPSNKDPVRAV